MIKVIFYSAILVCTLVSGRTAPAPAGGDVVDAVRAVVRAAEPPPAPPAPVQVAPAPAPAPVPAAPATDARQVAGARVSFQGDGQDIESLVDLVRRTAGVNVVMDTPAIELAVAAGTARRTITLKVDNMTLKSALNWICRLSGLAWTLQDEAIFITTPDRIKTGEAQLRVYDIRDLAAQPQDFPGPHIELVSGEADISISN
ncbi:MAG: hypothetical protein ABIF71_09335 [Planctomycetota bacterium]